MLVTQENGTEIASSPRFSKTLGRNSAAFSAVSTCTFSFFASDSLAGRSFSRLLREERQEKGDTKARSDGSGGKFFPAINEFSVFLYKQHCKHTRKNSVPSRAHLSLAEGRLMRNAFSSPRQKNFLVVCRNSFLLSAAIR